MSQTIDAGQANRTHRFSTESQVSLVPVLTSSTQYPVGLRIPTGHANRIDCTVLSDQTATAYLKFYDASGQLAWYSASLSLTANTVTPFPLATTSSTNSIGAECELVITNSSGSTANVTASLRAS